MQCSANGRQNLKIEEGIRFTAYKDKRGFDTIGVGHLIKLPQEAKLLTTKLTETQIELLLTQDLAPIEKWVNNITANWQEPITECEFDALCSFIFNETEVMYHAERFPETIEALKSGEGEKIIHAMMQFCNVVAGSGDNLLYHRRQREVALFIRRTY